MPSVMGSICLEAMPSVDIIIKSRGSSKGNTEYQVSHDKID